MSDNVKKTKKKSRTNKKHEATDEDLKNALITKKNEADNKFPIKVSKNKDETTGKGKSPLFPTVSCSDGSTKPIYGTNDVLELIQPIPSKIVEEKFDEVIKAVSSLNSICDYQKCKTRTNLIGQSCDFCRKRYCFMHGLPEIHGCGEAIKLQEQKKFRNPVPLKTLRHEKEVAQAKIKLETKLKDMKISRLAKPSGKVPQAGTGDPASSASVKKKKSKQ